MRMIVGIRLLSCVQKVTTTVATERTNPTRNSFVAMRLAFRRETWSSGPTRRFDMEAPRVNSLDRSAGVPEAPRSLAA